MYSVSSQLSRFRRRKILNDLQVVGWLFLSALAIATLLLVALEAIFWFPISVRFGVWQAGLLLVIIIFISAGIALYLIHQEKINRYSRSTLARDVGASGFAESEESRGEDEVLNALQLESAALADYQSSEQLANKFIQKVAVKLNSLHPAAVLQNQQARRFRLIAGAVLVGWIIVAGAFLSPFRGAATRWMHPRTNFPIPRPFELSSLSGDISLMGGDNANIEIVAEGKTPEAIQLEITNENGTSITQLARSGNGRFVQQLKNVFRNHYYRAFVQSSHFWEPWEEISSPTYTIDVTDRPTIEDFLVTITPPEYSRMTPASQKGNVAEIRGLKGSSIRVELRSDKDLSRAFLVHGEQDQPEKRTRTPMSINRKRATGDFSLLADGILETHIFDKRKIENLEPIQYRLLVIDDMSPDLQVLEPKSPMELGSDFSIPVHLQIQDDFGFSELQIVYETRHPDYVSEGSFGKADDMVSIHPIHDFSPAETSQDVFHLWDVNDLDLMPEDELRFHFELYDNDVVSGPKKSISPTLIAIFPSLADLFARTVEEQQDVQETAEEMMEELQELEKSLESVELDLLKNREVSWEQEQILKQSIQQMKEKIEQIQNLREQLQSIAEQAEKHDLFSTELVEKFRTLNDLLQDIMTPELLESMSKLQEAMESLSPEELTAALRNFRLNTDELEAQLDRFIDIFQRIQAEQRVDEVVTRLENLLKRQEALVKEIEDEETQKGAARLAEDQERNAQEFENIRDLMEKASENMQPFAKTPAQELSELANSSLSQQTSQDLQSATNELVHQNLDEGVESARVASQDLRQMLSVAQGIQQMFQQQTVDEMVARFEEVLQNTLFISKEQERLQGETANLPRNSPRLRQMGTRQQLLKDQLAQLIQVIMDLSHETFAVTPEMGKAIGRAVAGMNQSLRRLEERNGRVSAKNQGQTVAALNEAALATLAAMSNMQQSGMASGMEQFLQRMQQLSGQQAGINEQTLQLAFGQMAASVQQELMRRLSYEQGQLKKSLEQLAKEMRGARRAGGDLKGIAEEMEEVIKDFQRRKVGRKTVARQQRILSRMLDSQRSIRQRELSEKRKSRVAQEIRREGPSGLPLDLGQRRNLAMEALNLALKSGYSKDYQEMIRRYFNSLIESPGFLEQETHDEE